MGQVIASAIQADIEAQAPSWDALVLACKQCRKRRDGPRDTKAKVIALTFRTAMKVQRLKSRTLLTTCQGLCPKGATAVTVTARDAKTRGFSVRSADDTEAVVRAMSFE